MGCWRERVDCTFGHANLEDLIVQIVMTRRQGMGLSAWATHRLDLWRQRSKNQVDRSSVLHILQARMFNLDAHSSIPCPGVHHM
jgi:hypothetical protein